MLIFNPYRRIAEAPQAPKGGVSDAQATVLEDINRRANRKSAHEMEDAVKQEYIQAERKSRAQEEAVRKVHQKEVDKAMDVSLTTAQTKHTLTHTHTVSLTTAQTKHTLTHTHTHTHRKRKKLVLVG